MRGDIVGDPADRCADILRAGRPFVRRRQPIRHIDADQAVARRPERDVIVERRVGRALVAGGEAAAMHENQHRPRTGCALGLENVERVALVGAVFDVARDLDAGIRLLVVQRDVDRRRLRHGDDSSDAGDLFGDVGGHLGAGARAENCKTGGKCDACQNRRHGVLPNGANFLRFLRSSLARSRLRDLTGRAPSRESEGGRRSHLHPFVC